jgi:hypothetical protein
MKKTLAAASFSALLAIIASSTSSGFANWNTKYWANEKNFNRISSFNVSDNLQTDQNLQPKLLQRLLQLQKMERL